MANYNRPTNAFQKGNEFYKQVADPGRKKQFDNPNDLWKAACDYFNYCVDNPVTCWVIKRGKLVTVNKLQGMSLTGLNLHMGISSLNYYRKNPEFDEIIARIDDVIYVHNFTGAVTGILDGRIITKTENRNEKSAASKS